MLGAAQALARQPAGCEALDSCNARPLILAVTNTTAHADWRGTVTPCDAACRCHTLRRKRQPSRVTAPAVHSKQAHATLTRHHQRLSGTPSSSDKHTAAQADKELLPSRAKFPRAKPTAAALSKALSSAISCNTNTRSGTGRRSGCCSGRRRQHHCSLAQHDLNSLLLTGTSRATARVWSLAPRR
jgi:hypothetical protein